jgi:hypothetical protein
MRRRSAVPVACGRVSFRTWNVSTPFAEPGRSPENPPLGLSGAAREPSGAFQTLPEAFRSGAVRPPL